MFAVTSPNQYTVYFLTERPDDPLDHVIDDDVQVQPLAQRDRSVWPVGNRRPDKVLCRSRVNPKLYKEFKYRDEIDPAEFEETGKRFGGIYSKERWIEHKREADERVRGWRETVKALAEIPDEDGNDEEWDEVLRRWGVGPDSGEAILR